MKILLLLIALLASVALQAQEKVRENAVKQYNQVIETLGDLSPSRQKDGICASPVEEAIRAKLCNGDPKAVCDHWSEVQISREDILKPALAVASKRLGVPDAMAEVERTSETWFTVFGYDVPRARSNEERKGAYFYVLSSVQNELLKRLEKIGITKAMIEAKFKQIKSETITNLGSAPSSFELLDLDHIEYLKPDAKIGVTFSQSSTLGQYYEKCGIDGLDQQAVYDGVRHKVVLCPGFLYLMLKRESLDFLTHVLGHEIGHGAFFLQSPKEVGLEGYLSCVDKYYGAELTTQKAAAEYVEKTGLPALKKKVLELKAAKKPDLEQIRRYQRSIEVAETELIEVRADRNEPSLFGLKDEGPRAIKTNEGELLADWSSADTFGEELKTIPESKRLYKTIHTFNSLCHNKSTREKLELLYGPKRSEGNHPKEDLRIELSLKNPKIQKALGCRPFTDTKRPACSK